MADVALELPILDTARVEEVFGDDKNACRELLKLFVDEAEQQTKEVGASLGANQFERAAETAHSLKGAAANIGATRLASSARALELAAREHSADRVARCITEIVAGLRALAEEARRCLS